MNDDYLKAIEYLKNSKPQGKAVFSIDGKCFEADYNFDPPKVREIEMKEVEEQEEEE